MHGDDALRELLRPVRSIAVLGAKTAEAEDAWRVPRYLERVGFEVLAVNPKLARFGDAPAWPSLAALPRPVDLIEVFRASTHVAGHVDEILALAWCPRVVWLQLGIRDDAGAARLREAGIQVVQDRCLFVEHRRLFPGAASPLAHPAGDAREP